MEKTGSGEATPTGSKARGAAAGDVREFEEPEDQADPPSSCDPTKQSPQFRQRKARTGGGGGSGDAFDDPEEIHLNPFLPNCTASSFRPSPQCRNNVSRARWDEAMGMAEVIERKGSIWTTTGVVRLYCNVEEIGFLAERGALILVGGADETLELKDIYEKIAGGKYGCSWEHFEAYRHLKLLGYIIGRFNVPWTTKPDSNSVISTDKSSDIACFGIGQLLEGLHVNGLHPSFKVHLPNANFKKSSPTAPSFALCLLRNKPPRKEELVKLENQFQEIHLKYCYIDRGRVCFLSFDEVILPCLP